ncbi:U2 small nuclear ribonucleoprotein B [Coccidioides immitis RMSCC 3703]|uniref:U2 small nuclear ribonucleoprotein B n=1 Tax=Coccidioides immitis RMSCC 3703 TaxID=454286 RepID=A0A0J8R239_COCIT|nr:U2 small nuclear ribonucleoprotein B [Coccidioides immitis RMSCC 3703]
MAVLAPAASGIPPNSTTDVFDRVYVRNLEERIKVEQLKEALSEIFSEYGSILEIVAKTNVKAKGQAFIVFDNVDSATRAIEEINGFELFEKPMVLDYAKTRSDATVLREGGEQELEAHKRKRLAEKGLLITPLDNLECNPCANLLSWTYRKKTSPRSTRGPEETERPAAATADTRPAKTTRGAGLKPTGAAAAPVIPDEYLPPNKILFLREVPDSYDASGLTAIFSRFEGFKEVRMVPGRKGIAFVEYENETGAISAKEATSGMALGENGKPMRVTYQRQ